MADLNHMWIDTGDGVFVGAYARVDVDLERDRADIKFRGGIWDYPIIGTTGTMTEGDFIREAERVIEAAWDVLPNG